jgi:hypothetical protein
VPIGKILTGKQEEMARNVPLTRHGCDQCHFVSIRYQYAGTCNTNEGEEEKYE